VREAREGDGWFAFFDPVVEHTIELFTVGTLAAPCVVVVASRTPGTPTDAVLCLNAALP
jgi:hypothetical protein